MIMTHLVILLVGCGGGVQDAPYDVQLVLTESHLYRQHGDMEVIQQG